jgi:hypothetical protein
MGKDFYWSIFIFSVGVFALWMFFIQHDIDHLMTKLLGKLNI